MITTTEEWSLTILVQHRWTLSIAIVLGLYVATATCAHAETSEATVEQDPAKATCNDAVYRFLPGEFNLCLGRKMWARKDYKDAEQMLLLAAGWGSKPAQYMLGLAYLNGAGVAQDRPQGLAWLGLAAERKSPNYLTTLNSAYAGATAAEKAQASKLYDQLLGQYGDDVAAVRADKRFNRELALVAGNPVYQSETCVTGITYATIGGDSDAGEDQPNCPSTISTLKVLTQMAAPFFEGWKGRVDVGPVEQVKKP